MLFKKYLNISYIESFLTIVLKKKDLLKFRLHYGNIMDYTETSKKKSL